MSMQRIAIISAVSANSFRNRTNYKDYRVNGTMYESGLNFQKNFNIIMGGATLSFVIILICVMCYCFNRSINKNSMALYRQRIMQSMNEHNVDIYTVEQFYDAEPYVPLCHESQSVPQGLPPSYETVMASEKEFLSKYAEACRSKRCCKHSPDGTESERQACVANISTESGMQMVQDDLDDNGNIVQLHECNDDDDDEDEDEKNGNARKEYRNSCGCDAMNEIKVDGDIGIASTSTLAVQIDLNANNTETFDVKKVCTCPIHGQNNDRTPSEEIEILNDNGILRMDMSKIIDRTGLPTYDAALKLESYGYV